MNSSEELSNNITKYKKEKKISRPFDVCWQCKETNLSEDLRSINCNHKYHHYIIICLCNKCREISKHNTEDDNWVEELSKICNENENEIEMSKDIIRKSYLKFYKKNICIIILSLIIVIHLNILQQILFAMNVSMNL